MVGPSPLLPRLYAGLDLDKDYNEKGRDIRMKKVHIIPKEQAAFWLDKNGFWHTGPTKFENRKIINHFHSCIRYDESGYHLRQEHRHYIEKVYFHCEDTALFVLQVLKKEDIILVLNTGKRMKLKPRRLFTCNDNLYMYSGREIIKFTEGAMITIASELEDENAVLSIRVKGRRYQIPDAHE